MFCRNTKSIVYRYLIDFINNLIAKAKEICGSFKAMMPLANPNKPIEQYYGVLMAVPQKDTVPIV